MSTLNQWRWAAVLGFFGFIAIAFGVPIVCHYDYEYQMAQIPPAKRAMMEKGIIAYSNGVYLVETGATNSLGDNLSWFLQRHHDILSLSEQKNNQGSVYGYMIICTNSSD